MKYPFSAARRRKERQQDAERSQHLCAPVSTTFPLSIRPLLQQEEEEMRQEAERMQREADLKKEQEAERLRKLEEAAEKQRQREKEIEERAVS